MHTYLVPFRAADPVVIVGIIAGGGYVHHHRDDSVQLLEAALERERSGIDKYIGYDLITQPDGKGTLLGHAGKLLDLCYQAIISIWSQSVHAAACVQLQSGCVENGNGGEKLRGDDDAVAHCISPCRIIGINVPQLGGRRARQGELGLWNGER